jgi:CubicO group peptidase (beta-lactamase class C family)
MKVARLNCHKLVGAGRRVSVTLARQTGSMRGFAAAFALTVLLSLIGCSARHEDGRAANAAKLFAEWNKLKSPGCAIGVLQNDAFLLRRGYGSADLNRRVPIGPDTVFYVASMSKQFTAAAIGLLIENGRVSPDEDIRKYLPELPDYGEPVLVRDLVYHTSGIRDYISLAEDLSDYGRVDHPHTEADYLGLLARQRSLNFPPGTQFSYSNSNYFLLGILLKRATGTSLRQFADKHIFEPLGMRHTHFEDDYKEATPNRAFGYEPSGDHGFSVVKSSFAQVGDGGLLTTLNDLALWDREYYRNTLGGADLHRLLSATGSLRDGTHLNYAFGLYVDSSPLGPKVYHGGNDLGFRTRLVRYPEHHLSIICLCNLSSISTNPLAEGIAGIYLGSAAAEHVTEVPVSQEELRQAEGFYRDPSTAGIWGFKARASRLVANLLGVPGERLLVSAGRATFSTTTGSFNATFDFGRRTVRISEYKTPPTTFSRVELAKPARLSDYVGSYYSDELATVYELAVRNGQLTVLSPKAAAAPLSPTITDAFTGFGNYFLFERGIGNAVTGFRLGENTGRVRNLAFRKVQRK